jgi:hydroxylamine reductase (hybrid-cluster protein)
VRLRCSRWGQEHPPRADAAGFLSPNVAKVLVEKFGIAGVGTPDGDLDLFLN